MTSTILRPYQSQLLADVQNAWNNGAQNVLMRLDTGGGKTAVVGSLTRDHIGHTRILAHRQELVGQLSRMLARNGVRHNIVAAEKTVRAIARSHIDDPEIGRCFYDPAAPCVVLSVDTAVNWDDPYAKLVTLWIVDEGHHLVEDNKWHTVISRYTHPACRGLLPTATPKRADGKGLGRHADGVADVMVQGPPMRWMINNGYLTDYRIICPPSDMQVLTAVSASGDWSTKALKEAAQRSHIVGDVVRSYVQYATGKLGITFSTDVDTASQMTAAYRLAGVRAETLTGNTDDTVRRTILRRFAAREIDQIVAVDIISEGFDLPAIEVASMARPTASLAVYMQQFGRTLRPLEGKGKALIIDHSANVVRHQGPPDKPRLWSLDRTGGKSGPSDAIPIKVCPACIEPYERIYRACPHCGHYVEPAARGTPKAVDGDMFELDPAVLAKLRGEAAETDMTHVEKRDALIAARVPHVGVLGHLNRHDEKQEAQRELRGAMAGWGGRAKLEGWDDSQMQRGFWHLFGIDVYSAKALGPNDARALAARINLHGYTIFG